MEKHRLISAGILVCLVVSIFTKDFGLVLFGIASGATAGICMEYVGVRVIKLWSYAGKQGNLPVRMLLRGWGETGAVAVIAIQWVPNIGVAFLAALLFPLVAFELPNIRNKGWSYRAPNWLVVVGWAITIFGFQTAAKVVVLLSGRVI